MDIILQSRRPARRARWLSRHTHGGENGLRPRQGGAQGVEARTEVARKERMDCVFGSTCK